MACEPASLMELESRYLSALLAVDRADHSHDVLVLTGDAIELDFAPVPPIPAAQLLDTVWTLDSVVEGTGDDGAVSSVPPGYTLELRSDGTFATGGGCPPYEGEYILSGA